MKALDIRDYVTRFFTATDSQIIESSPGHVNVRLSEKADRDLVYRPFYWSYVEKLGIEPQPVSLSLIFDPTQAPLDTRGEPINLGSPRLQSIFRSACRHGRFVRLYEDAPLQLKSPRGSRPYSPWLAVNYKIEWICDQLRSEIHSLGLNLLDGVIEDNFYQKLSERKWTPRLPNHRFVSKPNLDVGEAVNELEFYVQGYLDQLDHTWAEEAETRMEEEVARLTQYYQEQPARYDTEEADTSFDRRVRETKWQYQPRVEVNIVNAGLFYMH